MLPPACGKTYLFNTRDDLTILDSDSSQFSWTQKEDGKVRNPDFPNNYIKHIKENIGRVDFIFVSSHKEVREALDNAGIEFYLVYPDTILDSIDYFLCQEYNESI